MEARSLVQHGPATLMVSLPAKWLKRNNLGKGDEIHVEEKGEELVLKSKGKKIKKQIEINITSSIESSIRAILTNLYRLGYEKITLNFSTEKILEIIEKETKNSLIGFEIIKRTKNNCVIENILEPSYDQFDNILSKLFLNIDDLFMAINSLSEGKKQEFESTERQIQAFDNFCRRMINRDNQDEAQLKLAFQGAVYHAQRELYFALRVLSAIKIKSNFITDLSEDARNLFNLLKKAKQTNEISILEKIHEFEKRTILDKGYSYLKKSKDPNERIIIYRLLSAIRNFYFASSPLIGLFILSKR
jgi:phosphate uptake regulator